jgi:hypothetical protein
LPPANNRLSRFLDAFAGEPPKRAVIAVSDRIEKVQASRASPEYKALVPLRDKAAMRCLARYADPAGADTRHRLLPSRLSGHRAKR